jgi:hypothetical protein
MRQFLARQWGVRRGRAGVCRLAALLCIALLLPVGIGQAASGSRYMFYDKFPANNPRQWSVLALQDGSRTYLASGTYHIVRAHPGVMRGWPLKVAMPAGMQFNAQMQFVSGKDPYEGITLWDDWSNRFVLFAVTPAGEAGLFRHVQGKWTTLVSWRPVAALRTGFGALNTLSVNVDPRSQALGRMFLVNGRPLGSACRDLWASALPKPPLAPELGLFAGLAAGSFSGATHVVVTHASMYQSVDTLQSPACPPPAAGR